MPKAIILVGWDDVQGPIIEKKYPKDPFKEEKQVSHFLTAIQSISVANTLELSTEDTIILLHGIPKSSKELQGFYNYRYICLIINQNEISDKEKYKSLLNLHGKNILSSDYTQRKKLFEDLVNRVFKPEIHKIVFFGFPNAGKSTTRHFIFEKFSEENLLNTSLKPTQGVEISYYDLLDFNVSLFDTSGQSMERWLNSDETIFPSASLVIFFFSYLDWQEDKENVLSYIKKMKKIIDSHKDSNPKVILFCHKADLIQDLDNFRNKISSELSEIEYPIFLTSIVDGGNQDFIIALQLIFDMFSDITARFNEIIKPLLEKHKIEPIALLDDLFRIMLKFQSSKNNTSNLLKINKSIKPIIQKLDLINETPTQFFLFQDTSDRNIGFLYFKNIVQSISYLIFVLNPQCDLSQFQKDYKQIKEIYAWNKEDNQKND